MTVQRRREARSRFTADVRLDLIEDDVDEHETLFADFRNELRKMNQILISILIALVTSSILLAVNAVINGGQ